MSTSLYDTARYGSNAALVESMAAQLKQKEGEIMQLQVLMGEHTRVKENMNKELTRLTIAADEVMQIKCQFLLVLKLFLCDSFIAIE